MNGNFDNNLFKATEVEKELQSPPTVASQGDLAPTTSPEVRGKHAPKSKKRVWKRLLIWGLPALAILIGTTFILYSLFPFGSRLAETSCKDAIRSQAKSPSTVVFVDSKVIQMSSGDRSTDQLVGYLSVASSSKSLQGIGDMIIKISGSSSKGLPDGTYMMGTWIDAQNAFGATVRNAALCAVEVDWFTVTNGPATAWIN